MKMRIFTGMPHVLMAKTTHCDEQGLSAHNLLIFEKQAAASRNYDEATRVKKHRNEFKRVN